MVEQTAQKQIQLMKLLQNFSDKHAHSLSFTIGVMEHFHTNSLASDF